MTRMVRPHDPAQRRYQQRVRDGGLRSIEQLRVEALRDGIDHCPYCEREVSRDPRMWTAHMQAYHAEEWDGELPVRQLESVPNSGRSVPLPASRGSTVTLLGEAESSSRQSVIQIDEAFQSFIPPLSEEERTHLEASLLAEGCREALVVWNGVLLDGHNRYAICQQHQLPFRVVEMNFATRDEALLWMIRNQIGRRNLTTYGRAALVLRFKALLAGQGQQGKRTDLGRTGHFLTNLSKSAAHNTRAELARLASVSEGTLEKVTTISIHAPGWVQAGAQRGDLSIDRAYRLTMTLAEAEADVCALAAAYQVTEPDTVRILSRLHRTGADTFAEVAESGYVQPGDEAEAVAITDSPLAIQRALDLKARMHARMAMDERRVKAAATPLPEGVYRTLVVDPPWPMEKIERDVRPDQGAYLPYPTLTLDEIQALPIPRLANPGGCHLYLWTTQKYVPDALALVAAWGFHYQCLLGWVKPTGMTPYSWMYNLELVVFARQGGLELDRMGLKLTFEAPSEGHSVKPEVFYERVRQASPAPRLEMFARRVRDGFTAWGDEV